MDTAWLPLTDYSLKYKVSVSTLRRRIKAEDIQFRFDDGKYFIFDEAPTGPPQPQARANRPSLNSETARASGNSVGSSPHFAFAPSPVSKKVADLSFEEDESVSPGESAAERAIKIEQNVLNVANNLLGELKKAYSQILQEKEEQILQLREEVSDLKTLVRVLESENLRLKN